MNAPPILVPRDPRTQAQLLDPLAGTQPLPVPLPHDVVPSLPDTTQPPPATTDEDIVRSTTTAPAETTPSLAPQPQPSIFRRALNAVENPSPDEQTIGRLLGGVGEAVGLAQGSAPVRQGILAQRELEAMMPLRQLQLQSLTGYHQGELANRAEANRVAQERAEAAQQIADTRQQQQIVAARMKGYVKDPTSPTGWRSMNEDEVLQDPILSHNQDLTEAAIALRLQRAAHAQAQQQVLMNIGTDGQPNPTFMQKERQIALRLRIAQQNFDARMQGLQRQNQEFFYNWGQYPGTSPGGGGIPRGVNAPNAPNQAIPSTAVPGSAGGLNLSNAPDMMLVNPATGLPIPNKSLAALKPTLNEQNRADFAASAIHSADRIGQLVAQAQAQVGPFSGRVAELMARAGLGDQFNQELQNYIRFAQSAATAAHTGRFSVPILEKMDQMIGPEMNPDQLSGAIESVKTQMAPYADAGWKPTVWEYRAWLGGTGTTPSGRKAGPTSPGQTIMSPSEWKKAQGGK